MLNAMGIGNNYIYQTDSGIEANKINDDMMREILQQTKRNQTHSSIAAEESVQNILLRKSDKVD